MKPILVSLLILGCLAGCSPEEATPVAVPEEKGPDAPLEGEVTGVDPREDLIVISLGESDGIEERQRLTIHQDGEEIARGAVGKVLEAMSGARVLSKTRQIRVGDRVRMGTDKVPPEPPPPPPEASDAAGPIEGEVLAVDPKNGVLIVNIGSNDSVQEGQEADVRRGEETVATAVVKSVLSDMSGFRILEQKEVPVRGDTVHIRRGQE